MRYRLQRHDGTDCSATMVPITVLRMVPIQRYRHINLFLNCYFLFLLSAAILTTSRKSHDRKTNNKGGINYQITVFTP